MSALLPSPVLSGVLFVAWLALANDLSVAHTVLAAALAVAIPHLTRRMFPDPVAPQRPAVIAKLMVMVLYDIVVSNVIVARRVLGPTATLRPAFFEVPLAATHPWAIALLASIITMTPGTVSCDVDLGRRVILVHGLDVADPAAAIAAIKSRYERPLLEIFGC